MAATVAADRRSARALAGGTVRAVWPEAGHERLLRDRMVAGDVAAFEAAYDEHAALVFGLCRRITGSSATAEELAQEVFVHLWEHPERFDPGRGTLRAYLGVMAHRRAIDRVRRDGRRTRREEDEALNGAVLGVPEAEGVEARALADELAVAVARSMDRLPAEQRRCVELAYFGGHTYREVADLLGIPEGTAKSRLRLALTKLADLLSAEGVDRWAP